MKNSTNYFKTKAALSAVNKNLQAKGYSPKQAYAMAGKIVAKRANA